MIVCKEDTLRIYVGSSNYEYFYPHELQKIDKIDREWAEKVRRFHKEYFERSEFDAPLAYVLTYEDERIVKVLAISLFTGDYGPEINVVDVDEWLQSHDDP